MGCLSGLKIYGFAFVELCLGDNSGISVRQWLALVPGDLGPLTEGRHD